MKRVLSLLLCTILLLQVFSIRASAIEIDETEDIIFSPAAWSAWTFWTPEIKSSANTKLI